jgi:hypothetical protein
LQIKVPLAMTLIGVLFLGNWQDFLKRYAPRSLDEKLILDKN